MSNEETKKNDLIKALMDFGTIKSLKVEDFEDSTIIASTVERKKEPIIDLGLEYKEFLKQTPKKSDTPKMKKHIPKPVKNQGRVIGHDKDLKIYLNVFNDLFSDTSGSIDPLEIISSYKPHLKKSSLYKLYQGYRNYKRKYSPAEKDIKSELKAIEIKRKETVSPEKGEKIGSNGGVSIFRNPFDEILCFSERNRDNISSVIHKYHGTITKKSLEVYTSGYLRFLLKYEPDNELIDQKHLKLVIYDLWKNGKKVDNTSLLEVLSSNNKAVSHKSLSKAITKLIESKDIRYNNKDHSYEILYQKLIP